VLFSYDIKRYRIQFSEHTERERDL
jgi:hypothetical protein